MGVLYASGNIGKEINAVYKTLELLVADAKGEGVKAISLESPEHGSV